jgi:YcxB-like protein
MTVEYTLSRGEVVKGYLYSWKYLPSFRYQMLILALGIGLLVVFERWLLTGGVRASDLRVGMFWGVGLFLFMPIWFALRNKRQRRRLEVSDAGIVMVMGGRTMSVPWSALSTVSDAKEFVIIARRNMNAFYIPKRAFTDDHERARFLESARMNLMRCRQGAG